MRAFLTFLIVAGAAAYGFLAVLHNVLPPAGSEYVNADQTEPHDPVRRLSSWGTYLPSPSTLVSNSGDKQPGPAPDRSTQGQPSMHASTPGESQIAAHEDPAPQFVQPSEPSGQPSLSSMPGYNTAPNTGVEPLTAKATPPTRKRHSRIVKLAPRMPDDATLATYGPQSGHVAPAGQRRGLGFFLFGRFAARD
jgi:hypothetical protein